MPDLLNLAIVFFVIALIFGVLGIRGAGISMEIAKTLIIEDSEQPRLLGPTMSHNS